MDHAASLNEMEERKMFLNRIVTQIRPWSVTQDWIRSEERRQPSRGELLTAEDSTNEGDMGTSPCSAEGYEEVAYGKQTLSKQAVSRSSLPKSKL